MSKKTVLHFVLIVLALALLTACSAPEPTKAPPPAPTVSAPASAPTKAVAAEPTKAVAAPTQPPAPTQAPTTKPTEVAKPVDLEIWLIPTSSQAPAPPDNWIGYKTIKDKLNINLKYVALPSGTDGETKLNAAAAANNLPDFFETVSTTSERNKLIDLTKQGLVAPVDSLLPLMPTRVKTHYNDPSSFALAKIDGKQMGFVEKPNLPRREGLVIRKDWLDKLGLKMPTTVDELITVAQAFTEKDPDGNGKNDTYGIGGFFDGSWGEGQRFAFIWGAYGVPDLWNWGDTANFGLSIRTPEFRQALEKFRRMNELKIIDPDWATINRDEFRIRWPQGRYGIMWEDFSALASTANYSKFDNNFPTGEWVAVPALKAGSGKNYLAAYGSVGIFTAVSKKALDAGKGPAIAKLLEWMASPEGYYLLGFGVDGVNYKLDKDGVVTIEGLADPKQAWTDASQQSNTQMRNQLIYVNEPKEVQARYPSSKSKNGRTISQMEFYQFFSTQPWLDSTSGQLIINPTNRADLQRFYNENFQAFALGSKPLTDQAWSDFLKGLDNNVNAAKWEADTKKLLQDAGVLKK
jgi:putative aldouronate transport system substrate-binding protein